MHRGSCVLIAGLLLSGVACAHRRDVVSDTGAPQLADSVTVNITNHSGLPMVIFASAPRQEDYRMGTVDPGTTGQFVLRFGWLWGRSVEFVGRVAGGAGVGAFSGHLNLRPGDVVDFEMTGGFSRATVRQ